MAGWVALEKMVMLVLLMLVGFAAAKAQWVDSAFSQKTSRLVANVFIVATILSSVVGVQPLLTGGEMAVVVAAVFVLFAIAGVLGWVCARLLPLSQGDRTAAWLSVFFMNNVFVGFPVVEALFGESAVFCASLTTLPALVGDTIKTLSGATVPLSMIVIGISLSRVPMGQALRDGKAYVVSLVRLLLCPLLVWLVLGLFLEGTTLGVLTVIAACPSGAMVSILSIRYGVDDTFASRVNFLSTILCAVTLPVVTSFLL